MFSGCLGMSSGGHVRADVLPAANVLRLLNVLECRSCCEQRSLSGLSRVRMGQDDLLKHTAQDSPPDWRPEGVFERKKRLKKRKGTIKLAELSPGADATDSEVK